MSGAELHRYPSHYASDWLAATLVCLLFAAGILVHNSNNSELETDQSVSYFNLATYTNHANYRQDHKYDPNLRVALPAIKFKLAHNLDTPLAAANSEFSLKYEDRDLSLPFPETVSARAFLSFVGQRDPPLNFK